MSRIICFVLATLVVVPTALLGQATDAADARTALASLRRSGSPHLATLLLAQERRSRSAQELDAFADSLVAIATAYRIGDPLSAQRAASGASVALVLATRSDRRTPYPRAFDALVRIFHGSSEPGVKGGTLWVLTQLPNLGPVIDFLAEVASSPGHAASTAVRHLAHETGPVGHERLHRLYETDAVVDPTARQHLREMAVAFGWAGS